VNVQTVVKESAEMQAARILRQQIVRGHIAAGSRVTEQQLAADLEISRATVRAALHQLSQEGLIIQIPYTGWTVVNLTSRDAWELFTLRASLESLAASLAAVSTDAVKRDLVGVAMWHLTKACRGKDLSEAAEADFALHEAIVELSGHRRLIEQYRLVGQQVRMYIVSSDALIPDLQRLVVQHQPIVDAVLNQKPDDAARLAEAHNTSEGEILVAHLKALEVRRRT
jgi:DNA-binding GntR family transcriptional regulator